MKLQFINALFCNLHFPPQVLIRLFWRSTKFWKPCPTSIKSSRRRSEMWRKLRSDGNLKGNMWRRPSEPFTNSFKSVSSANSRVSNEYPRLAKYHMEIRTHFFIFAPTIDVLFLNLYNSKAIWDIKELLWFTQNSRKNSREILKVLAIFAKL